MKLRHASSTPAAIEFVYWLKVERVAERDIVGSPALLYGYPVTHHISGSTFMHSCRGAVEIDATYNDKW